MAPSKVRDNNTASALSHKDHTQVQKEDHAGQTDRSVWIIVALVVLISLCHYLTPTAYHNLHEVYRRLYYLPIIFAAIRYALRGGLVVSGVVCFVYLPHVVFQWHDSFLDNLMRFTEIVLYLAVGGIAGFLSQRAKQERDRHKRAAEELCTSISRVKAQSEQLSEMETQLRAADRLAVLGELSASLAHEVRNPLGSIKGASDILRKRYPKDDTVQEFTGILSKQVERLNQVVDSYLGVARKPSHEERGDLVAVMRLVFELLGPEIRKKEIHVESDFPSMPLRVSMYEVEVQQVFLNILLNALSSLKDGGRLGVAAKADGRRVKVRVSDDGVGIPTNKLEKIFEPFYTTREEGTGLGLAIVKRIMEGHGGEISVESAEGKGTTFILTFTSTE